MSSEDVIEAKLYAGDPVFAILRLQRTLPADQWAARRAAARSVPGVQDATVASDGQSIKLVVSEPWANYEDHAKTIVQAAAEKLGFSLANPVRTIFPEE